MKPRLGRGWAVVAAASGTVVIGAGAFWLSFTALADLAERSGIPVGQAWIWPLLVDGLIVVATVAVVALDGHRTAWYPWSLLIAGALVSVTANAAHAIVAAIVSVPGVMAATVASVPPLVLLASTHLTVILIRSTKPDTAQTPPTEVSPANDAGRGELVEQTTAITPDPGAEETIAEPEPDAEPAPAPESLVSAAETASIPEPAQLPEPVSAPTPALLPESAPQSDAPPEAEPEPEPVVPVQSDQRIDRRERAEALREAGWSNKAIARELGVHASTVGRWFPRTSEENQTEQGAES